MGRGFIMDLEKIATASVKTSISMTDVLSPFINDGEKEPSWDGNIYIYSNKDKKKDGIKKVPVQVKGKYNNDFSKETIKFPVAVIDLENYLNDGGVIFFVVLIGNNGLDTKIYYSCLLPVKLRSILDNNIKKKKRSIELKPFPDDNLKKVSVLLNFYDHRQKQTSFVNSELQSLDELDKQGVLEGISLSVTNYGCSKTDTYNQLFRDDVYMYANIRGSAVLQPLMEIPMDLNIEETIEAEVSVNGVVYYSQFQIIRSKDKVILAIGESFTISKSEEKSVFTIKFEQTPILKNQVIDLEFILALHEYKQFEIGGHILPINFEKLINEENVGKLQQNLEYCHNLMRVLGIFKLDTEIDMNNLSEKDYHTNDQMIKGLLNNEPITGLKDNLPFVIRLNYLGTKVVVGLQKEDVPNTYRISDYFSEPHILLYREGDEIYKTSKYDFLKSDDFLEIRNLDYDDIFQSYQELSDEKNIFVRANCMLMQLIAAYDDSGDTRMDILDTAYKFAEWLYNADIGESELEPEIRILNLYQVLKRRGELSKAQKRKLFEIAEDQNLCKEIRIGANLLLDNQIVAGILFEGLSDDLKENFREFLFFRFWKETIEK